jgi:hypothetical protein
MVLESLWFFSWVNPVGMSLTDNDFKESIMSIIDQTTSPKTVNSFLAHLSDEGRGRFHRLCPLVEGGWYDGEQMLTLAGLFASEGDFRAAQAVRVQGFKECEVAPHLDDQWDILLAALDGYNSSHPLAGEKQWFETHYLEPIILQMRGAKALNLFKGLKHLNSYIGNVADKYVEEQVKLPAFLLASF